MFGLMLTANETVEVEYLLKRELEELLLDLSDERLDGIIHRCMEERYQLLFKLYKRFASPKDTIKYLRNPLHKGSDTKNKTY